jgi:hypothetical protein
MIQRMFQERCEEFSSVDSRQGQEDIKNDDGYTKERMSY